VVLVAALRHCQTAKTIQRAHYEAFNADQCATYC
jgi:hypothetical protein